MRSRDGLNVREKTSHPGDRTTYYRSSILQPSFCTVYAVQPPFRQGVIIRSDQDNVVPAKKFSAINTQTEDLLPSEQGAPLEHLNIMSTCFQFCPRSHSQMQHALSPSCVPHVATFSHICLLSALIILTDKHFYASYSSIDYLNSPVTSTSCFQIFSQHLTVKYHFCLTPRNKILLQKRTIAKFIKKFRVCHVNRSLVAVFAAAEQIIQL